MIGSRDVLDRVFDCHGEVAPLLLRLFVAFVLVYGTQDNTSRWSSTAP